MPHTHRTYIQILKFRIELDKNKTIYTVTHIHTYIYPGNNSVVFWIKLRGDAKGSNKTVVTTWSLSWIFKLDIWETQK